RAEPHRRTPPRLLAALQERDGGEQQADVVGECGVPGGVLLDRRRFAVTATPRELLGQEVERVAVRRGLGIAWHGYDVLSSSPGIDSRIARRRASARTYRLLAVPFEMPRSRATSSLLSSS